MAANAVTSAAIANGEIALVDLAADSVGGLQLTDNAINSNNIVDGAITQAKIDPNVELGGVNPLLFTGT